MPKVQVHTTFIDKFGDSFKATAELDPSLTLDEVAREMIEANYHAIRDGVYTFHCNGESVQFKLERHENVYIYKV